MQNQEKTSQRRFLLAYPVLFVGVASLIEIAEIINSSAVSNIATYLLGCCDQFWLNRDFDLNYVFELAPRVVPIYYLEITLGTYSVLFLALVKLTFLRREAQLSVDTRLDQRSLIKALLALIAVAIAVYWLTFSVTQDWAQSRLYWWATVPLRAHGVVFILYDAILISLMTAIIEATARITLRIFELR
jgi:hypothetical protein